MNRIVRENYPVSALPADIRKEFVGQDEVTLIVESPHPVNSASLVDDDAALAEIRRTPVRGGDFSRFKHLRCSHFGSSEEVVAYIGAFRDEWAHRER